MSSSMIGKSIRVSDATYILKSKLGNGGFGFVFLASVKPQVHCTRNLPKEVAIKVENFKKISRPQLEYEMKVYRNILRKIKPEHQKRIPIIYNFVEGAPMPMYKSLVMDRMSFNLMELFESYQVDVDKGARCKPFYPKDVYLVFLQALECLKAVHHCEFVHRDIKPENFCVRKDDQNVLSIVDFGLCKRFKRDGKHIKFRDKKSLLGTPRYMSLNCHDGYELSRRDDIESLLYMVLCLLNPGLPWQNVKVEKGSNPKRMRKKKYAKIAKIKRSSADSGELFRNTPHPFQQVYNEVRSMAFEAEPDYEHISNGVRLSLMQAEYNIRTQQNIPSSIKLSRAFPKKA